MNGATIRLAARELGVGTLPVGTKHVRIELIRCTVKGDAAEDAYVIITKSVDATQIRERTYRHPTPESLRRIGHFVSELMGIFAYTSRQGWMTIYRGVYEIRHSKDATLTTLRGQPSAD